MIKKSSFIVAILLIVCLSISSVSATAIDNNNSGNEILNSTGMTTEDINTINDCSVAKNIESEDSVESNVIDQSSVNMDKSSVSSDSNLGSEAQSSNDAISKDNVASDNVAVDEDSNSDVKKAKSTSFTNAKSEDSSESDEKMSADDVNALNAVSVADDFESEDSQSDNSGISVSNLASESQASNDDTSDESIGSVSVPYEVNNTNGGMSDNIGQANVASQDDVSDSVMITSTAAAMSISYGDVKNTEISSLSTIAVRSITLLYSSIRLKYCSNLSLYFNAKYANSFLVSIGHIMHPCLLKCLYQLLNRGISLAHSNIVFSSIPSSANG